MKFRRALFLLENFIFALFDIEDYEVETFGQDEINIFIKLRKRGIFF